MKDENGTRIGNVFIVAHACVCCVCVVHGTCYVNVCFVPLYLCVRSTTIAIHEVTQIHTAIANVRHQQRHKNTTQLIRRDHIHLFLWFVIYFIGFCHFSAFFAAAVVVVHALPHPPPVYHFHSLCAYLFPQYLCICDCEFFRQIFIIYSCTQFHFFLQLLLSSFSCKDREESNGEQ